MYNSTLFFAVIFLNRYLHFCRKSYDLLFSLDNSIFESGLVNAVVMLCSNLEMDLMCKPNITKVKQRRHFKP